MHVGARDIGHHNHEALDHFFHALRHPLVYQQLLEACVLAEMFYGLLPFLSGAPARVLASLLPTALISEEARLADV